MMRFPYAASGLWIRTYQECGHEQVSHTAPVNRDKDAFLNAKCKKCRSEALDYGQENTEQEDD